MRWWLLPCSGLVLLLGEGTLEGADTERRPLPSAPVLHAPVIVAPLVGTTRPWFTAPLPSDGLQLRGPDPVSGDTARRAVVERARVEVLRGVRYDASYRVLPTFPGGDVPEDVGSCTDLVVRALRAIGIDLQELVHAHVIEQPDAYPWEVGDANIDHRRVTTLERFFDRHRGEPLRATARALTVRAGDVVFYRRSDCPAGNTCGLRHVALVSDRLGPRGLPLVLQNGGPSASEGDALDQDGLAVVYDLEAFRRAVRSSMPVTPMDSAGPRSPR